MEDIYILKSKAYASIDHIFTKYPAAVDSVVVLKNGVATFRNKLEIIRAYNVPDRAETIPTTEHKAGLFDKLMKNAEVERSAIQLYADENQLPTLMGKMPTSFSSLTHGAEEEKFRRCQAIHVEAKNLGAVILEPWGCDLDTITETDSLLLELRPVLNATKNAISDRAKLQKGFGQCYKDMDAFLKKHLDKAVRTRLKEFPEFVKAYSEARVLPKSNSRGENQEDGETTTATKEVTALADQLQTAIGELKITGNGVEV